MLLEIYETDMISKLPLSLCLQTGKQYNLYVEYETPVKLCIKLGVNIGISYLVLFMSILYINLDYKLVTSQPIWKGILCLSTN